MGLGFRCSGLRVQGLGVQGLEFRGLGVQGLEFRALGVQGLGCYKAIRFRLQGFRATGPQGCRWLKGYNYKLLDLVLKGTMMKQKSMRFSACLLPRRGGLIELQGLGFRVQGLGYRVQGIVQGLGYRVSGCQGSRVSGSWRSLGCQGFLGFQGPGRQGLWVLGFRVRGSSGRESRSPPQPKNLGLEYHT